MRTLYGDTTLLSKGEDVVAGGKQSKQIVTLSRRESLAVARQPRRLRHDPNIGNSYASVGDAAPNRTAGFLRCRNRRVQRDHREDESTSK